MHEHFDTTYLCNKNASKLNQGKKKLRSEHHSKRNVQKLTELYVDKVEQQILKC